METIIGIGISVILAYIAYQNYRISKAGFCVQKDKLRLELFDKRYKIFMAVQKLLSVFISTGTFNRSDVYEFDNDSSDAEFLFGKDIKDYVDEISKKALELIHLSQRLKSPSLSEDGRYKIAEDMGEIEKWFMNQIQHSKSLFKRYFHFSIDKDF